MLLQFLSAAACALPRIGNLGAASVRGLVWYLSGFDAFFRLSFGPVFCRLVDAYAHWIIFLILSWIGIGMIKEAHEEVSCKVITGPLTMLGLAVATSIDALGVGVGFAFEGLDIGPTVLEIGTITFCLSFMGCVFGSYIGMKGKAKAELMGGLVLVGLGIKSLLGHYFF